MSIAKDLARAKQTQAIAETQIQIDRLVSQVSNSLPQIMTSLARIKTEMQTDSANVDASDTAFVDDLTVRTIHAADPVATQLKASIGA